MDSKMVWRHPGDPGTTIVDFPETEIEQVFVEALFCSVDSINRENRPTSPSPKCSPNLCRC